jgi:hypothetical protein
LKCKRIAHCRTAHQWKFVARLPEIAPRNTPPFEMTAHCRTQRATTDE